MDRRRFLGVALVSLVSVAVLALAPIAAAKGTCRVEPDPVIKPGDFTVYASGLTPTTDYWVRTDWRNQSFGHHADGSIHTDENGAGSWTSNTDAVPNNIIPVGEVRVRIYRMEGGRTEAHCAFTVVV